MTAGGLPPDEFGPTYAVLLEEIEGDVRAARARARRTVTGELVGLYWRIGNRILDRQASQGWGAKVIDRLAADLKAAFPDSRGFSRSNLEYMRRLAASHPDPGFPQQPAGELPWGHWMVLLDKLSADPDLQRWYVAQAVEHGWSRAVLQYMVSGQLHARQGAAPSNFPATLPAGESELAQQMTRDPYLLDFLGMHGAVAERDLEDALIAELERFLLELGTGFAFVGRQYPVRTAGKDYALDLLFFNWKLNCFVALEIQVSDFDPDHAGRLGFYVAWIDDRLRENHHRPTIGILICAGKTDSVVRYTLDSLRAPMAVATWTTLPPDLQHALPPADALEALVSGHLRAHPTDEPR